MCIIIPTAFRSPIFCTHGEETERKLTFYDDIQNEVARN